MSACCQCLVGRKVLKRGPLHAAQGEQQLDALLVVTPDGELLWVLEGHPNRAEPWGGGGGGGGGVVS